MKSHLPLLILVTIGLLFSGCATMAENRAANSALEAEVKTLGVAQNDKVQHARPLLIIGHNVTRPNSADGVGFTLALQNTSRKTIKYLHFTVTAINRVGDAVRSSVGGESTVTLDATGPFAPDFQTDSIGFRWGPAWYNNTIAFGRLDRVVVDYIDGTHETVEGDALAAIQLRPENNVFSAGIQQSRRVFISGGQLAVERLDIL
jgi:hypothetical protein